MHGAVAAGAMAGGYDSISDAAVNMVRLRSENYQLIPENKIIYDQLFTEYVTLHDYFGRDEKHVMKRPKDIKAKILTD